MTQNTLSSDNAGSTIDIDVPLATVSATFNVEVGSTDVNTSTGATTATPVKDAIADDVPEGTQETEQVNHSITNVVDAVAPTTEQARDTTVDNSVFDELSSINSDSELPIPAATTEFVGEPTTEVSQTSEHNLEQDIISNVVPVEDTILGREIIIISDGFSPSVIIETDLNNDQVEAITVTMSGKKNGATVFISASAGISNNGHTNYSHSSGVIRVGFDRGNNGMGLNGIRVNAGAGTLVSSQGVSDEISDRIQLVETNPQVNSLDGLQLLDSANIIPIFADSGLTEDTPRQGAAIQIS